MSDKLDPSKNGAIEELKKNKYNENNPMDGNSVIALKNHIERVSKAIESNTVGGIAQAALKLMNPGPIGSGKILNPLFQFGAPPFAGGVFADAVDASSIPEIDIKIDRLKADSLARNKNNLPYNLYDDKNKATENTYVDVEIPDLGVDGMSTKTLSNGVEVNSVDYSKIFNESNSGIDFGNGAFGGKSFVPKKENRLRNTEDRKRRIAQIGEDDAFFSPSDLERGYITEDEFDTIGINDSTNYLPFFLEDLRDSPSQRKRIYFRAFFKNLRETITPNWSSENYFGRVDPVGIYTNTSRTISLSFAMVAFSPQGFTAMWRKINQLTKLTYPTFKDGVMIKSPVCRLRVGDVICDSNGNGLPGYINSSLEFDYSDAPWEINEWIGPSDLVELGKAPQMVICSFSFQVIHEINPKVDHLGNFDTNLIRRIGSTVEPPISPSDEEEG
jgi:hypothetical protein